MSKVALGIAQSRPVAALRYINECLLSPAVSAPLLLAFLAAPDAIRDRYLTRLTLPSSLDINVAKLALQVLLGVGVVRFLNLTLNSMANNAWRVGPAKGWDWLKEVAVVTGGCSGIGLATVQRLSKRGVKVAVLDIQALPKGLQSDPNIRWYKCDATSPASVSEAAAAVRLELGHPSILVNNAGITRPLPILDMPQDFLRKIFEINSMCHWTMVQEFMPHMIKVNKGHIVTVASIASFVAIGGAADYSATKAAALAFHESLSSEIRQIYKADGVLTTVVHPNFVQTPLVADFQNHIEDGGLKLITGDHVAKDLTDQVFARRGAQVVVPSKDSRISSMRAWPMWLQVLIRDFVAKRSAKLNGN